MSDVKKNEMSEEAAPSTIEEKYGFSKGDTADFKWYIARTKTGQENKVVKALKERIVSAKLTNYFADIMTPEDSVTTNISGKKRTLKKKIFPGYVLIKMVMNEQTWHLVRGIDKISGFVGGTTEKPIPISDEEAAFMTKQNSQGFKRVKTSLDFSEGESVRVIEGPFTSFVGVVESVSDKGKIKVSVSIFGRPTPVELEFSQVEKVSS
jgi:transcriptional antiterminator NusG